MKDRQQINVSERELIADEKACFRDGPVKNSDLLAHRRHHGFDRPSVGFSIGGF
jgi:hypothetical protein